jgi:hypothetical protein
MRGILKNFAMPFTVVASERDEGDCWRWVYSSNWGACLAFCMFKTAEMGPKSPIYSGDICRYANAPIG